MREHKYKAKRLDGQWVEGYYWQNNCGNHFIRSIFDCDKIVIQDYEINPDTICEFTGLYDKNKHRIWENDIILTQPFTTRPYSERKQEKRLKGIVEYKLYRFPNEKQFYDAKWKLKFLENEETLTKYRYSCWPDFWDCKVIGNIFDNPELLEVK